MLVFRVRVMRWKFLPTIKIFGIEREPRQPENHGRRN